MNRMIQRSSRGFTLIELSIVLVIIGLIIGGVLVGQDLISAAAVRAQITQIEKYQTAVNTFRGKYNDQLPGDIDATDASQFGFAARGSSSGQGDGNGVIQSWTGSSLQTDDSSAWSFSASGEEGLFWRDLSAASLIDGSFSLATATGAPTTASNVAGYFPLAKLGGGNYIIVITSQGIDYYAINNTPSFNGSQVVPLPGMTVSQAYGMDKKVDDGLPVSGKITASYTFVLPPITLHTYQNIKTPDTTSASPSTTSCYSNGGVSGATQQYSLNSTIANNINCAVAIQFQ